MRNLSVKEILEKRTVKAYSGFEAIGYAVLHFFRTCNSDKVAIQLSKKGVVDNALAMKEDICTYKKFTELEVNDYVKKGSKEMAKRCCLINPQITTSEDFYKMCKTEIEKKCFNIRIISEECSKVLLTNEPIGMLNFAEYKNNDEVHFYPLILDDPEELAYIDLLQKEVLGSVAHPEFESTFQKVLVNLEKGNVGQVRTQPPLSTPADFEKTFSKVTAELDALKVKAVEKSNSKPQSKEKSALESDNNSKIYPAQSHSSNEFSQQRQNAEENSSEHFTFGQ